MFCDGFCWIFLNGVSNNFGGCVGLLYFIFYFFGGVSGGKFFIDVGVRCKNGFFVFVIGNF